MSKYSPCARVPARLANPWQVQEYILETLGTQYPRKVCFEVFGDNVNKFPMQVGQEVTVSIDVESREFNGRWYTSVRAWNVVQGIQLPRCSCSRSCGLQRTSASRCSCRSYGSPRCSACSSRWCCR